MMSGVSILHCYFFHSDPETSGCGSFFLARSTSNLKTQHPVFHTADNGHILGSQPSQTAAGKGQKRALRVYTAHDILPETAEYAINRINRKQHNGNLQAWLYGWLLSLG
jgi:hypothetical protein